MPDEYLTTKQVSQEWPFLPTPTLRYWRQRGIGPASFQINGRGVLYKRSDVEAWLAAREAATRRGGVQTV